MGTVVQILLIIQNILDEFFLFFFNFFSGVSIATRQQTDFGDAQDHNFLTEVLPLHERDSYDRPDQLPWRYRSLHGVGVGGVPAGFVCATAIRGPRGVWVAMSRETCGFGLGWDRSMQEPGASTP